MSVRALRHQSSLVDAAMPAQLLLENIVLVVRGKERQIRLVLTALMSRGHVLLEDVPGTAKTVLARALGQSIGGASTSRIQCTPDLQPTDVTGLSIWNPRDRSFEFRTGPVFANVVLVDEVNRAMPKTQSALLEAMAESQVSIDGTPLQLPRPFLVLATENPIEHAGTFPLPEAQLDRFFLRTALGYPDAEQELRIIDDQRGGHPLERLEPVISKEDVLRLQAAVEEVYVDRTLKEWIVGLVSSTRDCNLCRIGSSVRGTLALERAVRAWALLDGRDYAVPEDVEELFPHVIEHRVIYRNSVQTHDRARLLWEHASSTVPRSDGS
jgi:MoxR-like ATPase